MRRNKKHNRNNSLEFQKKFGIIVESRVAKMEGAMLQNIECDTPMPPTGELQKSATAQQAVVATAFPDATAAALDILATGGNAVDAAVAAAWALSVCEPSGSGLGGQTNLMVHLASGKTIYLDGHSHAPAAISPRTVKRRQQMTGYRACTIPSTVVVLDRALSRFGTFSLEAVMQPAVRLAKEGFVVTRLQHQQARWRLSQLGREDRTIRILRRHRWHTGERLAQPRLAKTLTRIARTGCADFYHGHLANDIVDDMERNGGLITARDLASTRLPVVRKTVSIDYRGYKIVTTPPPGGGLQLLLALKLLERLLDSTAQPASSDWYEAIALATHAAFVEREKFPIHPDDFSPSLQQWALSDARADELALPLYLHRRLDCATTSAEGPGETTHLCVADDQGNIVSLTQSIQSLFGARVANARLGFLYNNYLTTCPRYPHPYQLGSSCLPRSNAAPTLVMKNGKVVVALGAAGSRRITSSILQIISRVIDLKMPLSDAIAAPRIHALLNGQVWIERPAATAGMMARLEKVFARTIVRSTNSFTMAGAQAVAMSNENHLKHAAADPRRDGAAGGY